MDENYTDSETVYELLWEARRKMMQDIIDAGERHPHRVIHKFESMQRQHVMGVKHGETIIKSYVDAADADNAIQNVSCTAEGKLHISAPKYLPTRVPLLELKPFKDHNIEVPYYTHDGHIAFIADYLKDHEVDAVVELGSGYAKNLIDLYYLGGPKVSYYAGEITKSGTATAQMLADLTTDFKLIPFRFNYRQPDLSAVVEKKRLLFFTMHSIEQVNKVPEELFVTMAKHAEHVTCIHLEPFGYQFKIGQDTIVDEQHKKFFTQKGWNENLFSMLLQCTLQKHIKLKYICKNMMGGHYACPTSLAVWTN